MVKPKQKRSLPYLSTQSVLKDGGPHWRISTKKRRSEAKKFIVKKTETENNTTVSSDSSDGEVASAINQTVNNGSGSESAKLVRMASVGEVDWKRMFSDSDPRVRKPTTSESSTEPTEGAKRKASVSPEASKGNKKPAVTMKQSSVPRARVGLPRTSARVAHTPAVASTSAASTSHGATKTTTTTYGVPTGNRYEILSDNNSDDPDDSDSENEDQQQTRQTQRKQKTPTPIIIPTADNNHTALVNIIKRYVTGKFTIKYTTNNANITIMDIEDKTKLLTAMKNNDVPFHTYTDTHEKSHAFVLKGLHWNPPASPEEVQEELEKTYGLTIKQVYRMKTNINPMYLVITTSDITLKEIRNKIKYLLYTTVSWERHINKKVLTQCRRCQRWNHATSNCNRPPMCLKCAKQHLTKDCQKSREEPAECINCGGAHPANAVTCPVYIRRLKDFYKRAAPANKTAKQQYAPAPPPATNAWAQRQQPQDNVPFRNAANPNALTRQQFPPLPPALNVRRRSTPNPPTPAMMDATANAINAPPTNVTGAPAPYPNYPAPSDKMTEFVELTNELNKLHSLINIPNMLRAVKELNKLLVNCNNDDNLKFHTMLTFTQNISQYNI